MGGVVFVEGVGHYAGAGAGEEEGEEAGEEPEGADVAFEFLWGWDVSLGAGKREGVGWGGRLRVGGMRWAEVVMVVRSGTRGRASQNAIRIATFQHRDKQCSQQLNA